MCEAEQESLGHRAQKSRSPCTYAVLQKSPFFPCSDIALLTVPWFLGRLRLERVAEDMDYASLVIAHHLRCFHGQCIPV